jgi:hypothetical protein
MKKRFLQTFGIIAVLTLLALSTAPAAKQTAVFQPIGYTFQPAQFTNSDGTTAKVVATAGADDSVVKAIAITNSDASNAYQITLIVNNGTSDFVVDTINVPAGSGTDGTHAAVDGLANALFPLDSNGKKVLPIQSGFTIKGKMVGAVGSGKFIVISVITQDF